MAWLCSIFLLIGRLGLAAIFLFSGISKFVYYDATIDYMASRDLPMLQVLLVVAALAEIIGALSLIFGFKTRFGALLLIVFLIPTTLLFHNFWEVPEVTAKNIQMIMFMKNLAIIGGLFYVLAVGAGKLSLDRCFCGCAHSCYVCGCSHSAGNFKTDTATTSNNTKV